MESEEDNLQIPEISEEFGRPKNIDLLSSYICDGPIINDNSRKAAQKLLENIESMKNIINVEQLAILCKQIVNHKNNIKFRDPYLYMKYEYDGRDGNFRASRGCLLSEFIRAKVCGMMFCYFDVLGKHSELDFTINDVEYEYRSEIVEENDDYVIDLDSSVSNYDYDICDKVLYILQKYMYELEPVPIEIYRQIRENELISYAGEILDSLTLTIDPMLEIFPPTKHFCCRPFRIFLSVYLTYLCKIPDDIIFQSHKYMEPGQFNDKTHDNYKWNETIAEVTTHLWNNHIIPNQFEETTGKIKLLLATYEPLPPAEFFSTNFKIILERCKSKYI